VFWVWGLGKVRERLQLKQQFEGDFRVQLHLAPPLLAQRDKLTGTPRKMHFGPWILKLFRVLGALRRLRGTRWDVFGYTKERRTERQLIAGYEALVSELCGHLTEVTLPIAIELANVPDEIRGFGHVKDTGILRAKQRQARLLAEFRAMQHPMSAAA
jgi:indolepyruvate ferredoxin oxidoreductase